MTGGIETNPPVAYNHARMMYHQVTQKEKGQTRFPCQIDPLFTAISEPYRSVRKAKEQSTENRSTIACLQKERCENTCNVMGNTISAKQRRV